MPKGGEGPQRIGHVLRVVGGQHRSGLAQQGAHKRHVLVPQSRQRPQHVGEALCVEATKLGGGLEQKVAHKATTTASAATAVVVAEAELGEGPECVGELLLVEGGQPRPGLGRRKGVVHGQCAW